MAHEIGAAPRTIRVRRNVLAAIEREAEAAYPNEACGALVGPAAAEITGIRPLPNVETGQPRTRFRIEPHDYIALEEDVDREGLRLLGFWHSHPDHPADPSTTDRRHAWPGLLAAIVSVDHTKARETTFWALPDDASPDTTTPYQPLAVEPIP